MGLRVKGERFATFSIRFEDAEFDETPYQRMMAAFLGSDHREISVGRLDVARIFPEVVEHAERPLLRTAPAPLFLLSRLVRDSGIKVVLTGEGADEMFAGYDLFREGKIRRFWGRQPTSRLRPRLLERLYPYMVRSPVAQRTMAQEFFGRDRDRWAEPGFAHRPRWESAAALQRMFSLDVQREAARVDVTERLLASLPVEFDRWSYLAQDQYLEVRTLLSGYLLSSQGDRMLMANSVEGRFPFLDRNVADLAASLPDAFKLHGLDEKYIVKRAADGPRPGRHHRATQATVSRPGCPVVRRCGCARLGGGHRQRAGGRRTPGSSIPRPSAGCGASAATRRTVRDSRTPTTWRWWASCRPGCCTSASCDRRHRGRCRPISTSWWMSSIGRRRRPRSEAGKGRTMVIERLARKIRLSRIRRAGAQIPDDCRIGGLRSWPSFGSEPYLVSIGHRVGIAGQGRRSSPTTGGRGSSGGSEGFEDVIKYGRITIHDDSIIGYGAILLPGIEIGPNSVVAAGAVVGRSVPPNMLAAGVPARVFMTVDDYAKQALANTPKVDRAAYRRNKRAELLRVFPRPW